MKDHISFICKTAFPEIRRVSTIRHHLTDDVTKTLVSLVLSRIEYCNSLGWSPSVLGRQTSESPKQCSPSCSPHTSTCSHHSDTQKSLLVSCQPEFTIRLHASVSTLSPPPPLLISLTFYICTLLLDLYAPVPKPASSKFHSMSARQKVIVLSLTLVPLSGTHCHCALEMLQLSTPSRLL